MITRISGNSRVYLSCSHIDMRKSINGLAAVVQGSFELDLFDGILNEISVMNAVLDNSNGMSLFEIKFMFDGKEYKYKIHAETEEILEAENED